MYRKIPAKRLTFCEERSNIFTFLVFRGRWNAVPYNRASAKLLSVMGDFSFQLFPNKLNPFFNHVNSGSIQLFSAFFQVLCGLL